MRTNQLALILAIGFLIVSGCAGHRTITTDEAFWEISPAAPLPQHALTDQLPNLIVRINNVADLSSSYRNYVELFINGFKIEPESEITNIKRNYLYQLKLQPGIYEISGKYYASTGWKIKKFNLRTKEQVLVFPDKKTTLDITLCKDSWGGLKEKDVFFDVSYKDQPPKRKK